MKSVLRVVLWLLLAGTVGFALTSARSAYLASSARNDATDLTLRSMGVVAQPPKHLAAKFNDSQNRMLADPPATADQLIDPPTIVIAHVVGDDSENPGIDWQAFARHIGKAIGRPVVDQPFENNPDDLAQIKDGKITLVALHAAEAPFLVNEFGFQPMAVLGDDSGAIGNHLDIIVPADSAMNAASELCGRSLVCTVPSSVTGYRAAVALLLHNQGLRPNVDYTITWSMGQKKSINGVIKHTYGAAAVSDDKLQNLLKRGKVSQSEYRIIYTSEVIPRTTIGCFYNLKPELAGKIRDAILEFKPAKSVNSEASDGDSSPLKHMHFLSVDYKKDFQLVREIDDSFDPRLGAKPPKQHAAPTTEPQ